MIPAVILRIEKYTESLMSLMIRPSDPNYRWIAGQWVDVAILPDFRMAGYSFCSPTGSGSFSLLIRKSSHPVTQWIYSSAAIGSNLFIGEASGSCVYKPEEQEEIVCFAGGIGITPMISITRTARRLGKKHTLYHSIKTQEENVFAQEIPKDCVYISDRIDFHKLVSNHPSSAHFFVCGPKEFIDEGVDALEKHNCVHIHYERWW